MEMKIIAFVNLRIGPNRIGPWGTLSSTIHGLKVLAKEDFTPTGVDVPVFTLAPAVVYLAAVLTLLVIPFAPGMVGYEMELGLLYFFAVGGLGVIGLMMAGWSSFNKYSLLGGLRAAAAIISYELPLILGVMGIVLLAGHAEPGHDRGEPVGQHPRLVRLPAAARRSSSSSSPRPPRPSRTPFDLTEADSEIVAGFATEYSGMRFGFFFFAEYVNVFILSALTVTLFLGGWNGLFDIDPLLEALGIATPVSLAARPRRRWGRGCWPSRCSCRPSSCSALDAPGLDAQVALGHRASRCSSGFLLFNLLVVGRADASGRSSASTRSSASFWFLLKSFAPGGLLRAHARHAAARAHRPAHGLRLEVADAGRAGSTSSSPPAPSSSSGSWARREDRPRPRPGHRQGPLVRLPPGLPAQGHRAVPGGPEPHLAAPPRPPHPPLRRGRHAQVRDLLPVRGRLPHRVHRHGRRGHAGPLPRPLGPGRAVRRAARGERPAPLRAGPCRTARFDAFEPIDLAPLDAILAEEGHRPRRALAILEQTQEAYGHLPVAALQHIAHQTGAWYSELYGIATSYPHLRFEPPGGHVVRVCRCTAVHAARRRARAGGLPASTSARTSAASAPTAPCASRRPTAAAHRRARPRVEVDGEVAAARVRAEDAATHRGRAARPRVPGAAGVSLPILRRRSRLAVGAARRARPVDPEARHRGGGGRRRLGGLPRAPSRTSRPSALIAHRQRVRPARSRRRRLPDRSQVARLRRPAADAARRASSPTASRRTPGAQVDRTLMELDPHAVVEGVALAAWAVGAERGHHRRARLGGHGRGPAAGAPSPRRRRAATSARRPRPAGGRCASRCAS